jgi:isopentenyl diphosphate isomerase/L-lactate dehydrogenase-like FMN-dependent dehydrogenase
MASGLDNEFKTLHEFVKAARMKLDPVLWDYLVGGSETETTLKRNRMAIDSIAFRPRILNDVREIDPTSSFLGKKVRLPVLIAPVGGLPSFAPGGGVTVAKGARAFGIPMILSSVNAAQIEEIGKQEPGFNIFQLYVRGDEAFIDSHADRVVAAGYDAFCFTVDSAIYSRRERDISKRAQLPWRGSVGGLKFQAGLSWKGIERFKKKYKIPLIIKGIATAEDARMAVEHGVEVVYVSNHGGRQLDHGRGSIDVLPEVVDAIKGRAKIVVDGAFYRGSDIIKAITLGADMVGIGRLYCYAMAAAGAAGIERMLEILENEVISSLGLLGVTSFKQLDRSYLHFGAPVVTDPHVHSAYPLLNLTDPGYGGR